MRSDADRFRFLAEFEISITWNDARPSLFWRGRASPGQPGAFYPIGSAPTLEQAVDQVIERWERQHGRPYQAG